MRRLAAEGVGTALLVLFGAGSVIAALTVGDGALDSSRVAETADEDAFAPTSGGST